MQQQELIIKCQNCGLKLLAVKCGQYSPAVDIITVEYAHTRPVSHGPLMHQAKLQTDIFFKLAMFFTDIFLLHGLSWDSEQTFVTH